MQVRRVVTGQDRLGKGIVVSDELVAAMSPAGGRWSVWAADAPVALPNAGNTPPFAGPLLPAPGGFHVLVLTLPPHFKRDASGMHATPSVDCMMQVSGESIFVLEDTEVLLRAGDWLISNGVSHDWRNDGDEASVMIGVVYGATTASLL
jgi:hypothetical protein